MIPTVTPRGHGMLTRTSSAPQPLVLGTHGVSTPARSPAVATVPSATGGAVVVPSKYYAVCAGIEHEKNADKDPPIWPSHDSIFTSWIAYGQLSQRSGCIHQSFTIAEGGRAAAERFLAQHGNGLYQRVITPANPATPTSAYQNAFRRRTLAYGLETTPAVATPSSPSPSIAPSALTATLAAIESGEEDDEENENSSDSEASLASTEGATQDTTEDDSQVAEDLQQLGLDASPTSVENRPAERIFATSVGTSRAGTAGPGPRTAAAALPASGTTAVGQTYSEVRPSDDMSWLDPELMASPSYSQI
ncbi:hypothetical protein P7C70_g6869, partial [Phenoliferia sp. Uapishka_3]